MDLSKKILLASCGCAAVLAGVVGCMVEDRNLEEKGLFLCMVNEDCLSGNECVKDSGKAEDVGHCVRTEDVDHCHDYDKDGYYAADTEPIDYTNQCGFDAVNNPQDADDSDPNVNPKATEICDGKDNNQDGCVDGKCPDNADCTEDPNLCERLFQTCFGYYEHLSDVISTDKVTIVCDPTQGHTGAKFCVNNNGKFEYAYGFYNPTGKFSDNTDVIIAESGVCPSEEEKGYVELESDFPALAGNGIDEDCDGMDDVKEKCESVTDETQKYCAVYKNAGGDITFVPNTSSTSQRYNSALKTKACNGSADNCPCVGTQICLNESDDAPSCVSSNGTVLSKLSLPEGCESL